MESRWIRSCKSKIKVIYSYNFVRYFTPTDKWYENQDFVGFTLKSTTDKEKIMIVESKNYNQNDILVMIFYQYNLEIISEMRVAVWDPNFNPLGYDFTYDYYVNSK